ncbi:hypothetical protein GCM10009827_053250 [Dactylosporangium maewongense]|uniref:Uncharacterized protein n=1 Tax=Dactylosporangium maewongense TaxID=634393 RepID=A0ABN2AYX4_9ACTN
MRTLQRVNGSPSVSVRMIAVVHPTTDEEPQIAVRHLCRRLRDFLNLDPAAPSVTSPPGPRTPGH